MSTDNQALTTQLPQSVAQRRRAARLRRVAASALTHGAIWILLAFAIFPFYWAIASALKPFDQLYTLTPTFWPKQITFDNFRALMHQSIFMQTLRNSIIVAILTPLVSIVITSMTAYSLARFRYRFKDAITISLVVSQMLPGVLLVIPLFVIMRQLQDLLHIRLINSYTGLIIGFATFSVPFCTLFLRGFFSSFPVELEEAALIDGCNRLQAFLRVVLPLSIPGVLTVGLFAFILAWNDLLFAMVITQGPAAMTVAVHISQLVTSQVSNTNYALLLAEGIVITIPVVVVFVLLQRYLIAGLTAGAIKG
ncbi:MAG: ABC transporter permease [Chloroflexi bacterium]|nr:MAG: ABC transporter permease [Chloroflexota bacterium]